MRFVMGFMPGFLSEPNSGFLYFPSRGSGKTVIFPRSHSVYALYGSFPERQRNENLKLPVLNIREELSAVFAADSLHVAHSVAMASGQRALRSV